MNGWSDLFNVSRVFAAAFREQRNAIRSVYELTDDILRVPSGTPAPYDVSMRPVPDEFYTLRKNIFSTLFQSMYHLMECEEERRAFYGKLIHLFRIWVTSADNLLDDEDKEVLPLQMSGESRVMRQVVSIMAADRVLQGLLADGVESGLFTAQQAKQLSFHSLQILLPSAAQEASEEAGVTVRPDPETVLTVIHRYKTGILFNAGFMAPEILEPAVQAERAGELKAALMQFGVGCQILDDIRDLARDYVERRHNVVLSELWKNHRAVFQGLETEQVSAGDRLYLEFLPVVAPYARRGFSMMREGLSMLGSMGLGISNRSAEQLADSMFAVLDLKDLNYAQKAA